MATRRTASQIATIAALAVASFGGSFAHAGSIAPRSGSSAVVVVFGGWVVTLSWRDFGLTGVSQQGGGG
ncbi:MAG: hypothetical protein ACKO9D_05485 [Gammaproteobacteria bacterium]